MMDTITPVDTELKSLRRQVTNCRRMILLGGALVAVLLILGMQSQPSQDVVRAQRFEVVDEQGRVRAVLSTLRGGGHPTLTFLDAEGNDRINLHAVPHRGPMMEFIDDNKRARMRLSLLPDGNPILVMNDPDGQARMSMLLRMNDGGPFIRVLDDRQRVRGTFGLTRAVAPKACDVLSFASHAP
ncbi:hypothetical protein ACERK3_16810 [Phycisphaerales bacterium AB-hyl4]|uniref:Uncharacterized protein n=1 Tax=Natronomicrosphaera hydrolytica TaxID=3242702 RepID=A0ABV4U9I4_9BACT